jgi:hypothetical protein
MKTIYLSGASAELSLCETYRDQLIAEGWTLTLDWMKKIREVGIADQHLDTFSQRRVAYDDLCAAGKADVFWLILPNLHNTIGAWVELGWVLALEDQPEIVISGSWRSIFDQTTTNRFHTHNEAFDFIQKLHL